MFEKNFYELLGVARTANLEEIKKAYRRLAHQFHPDKNPGNPAAEEHFKRITQAYEILQNAQKRATYDRTTADRGGGGGFGGFRKDPGFSSRDSFSDDLFQNFFGDLFSGMQARPSRAKGADLRYHLELSLEEAAVRSEHRIRVPRLEICPICRGTRCSPGTAPLVCPTCQGWGTLRTQRGFFMVETTCGHCRGEREIIRRPCSDCGGVGRRKVTRTLQIQVPPGVDIGTCLRLNGEGEIGKNGGPSGDLYIDISLKKHPFFTRVQNDLLCEIFVTPIQASGGVILDIPTLQGNARLKVPSRTISGKVFTLKGKGMPILQGGGCGDQKVTIRIKDSPPPS